VAPPPGLEGWFICLWSWVQSPLGVVVLEGWFIHLWSIPLQVVPVVLEGRSCYGNLPVDLEDCAYWVLPVDSLRCPRG
jgi:hypothetical protein